MLHKENPRCTFSAKLHFISMLFFFLFVSYSQAITITDTDPDTPLTTGSDKIYAATGCSGSVAWSVTGTGASISSNGVLTAEPTSCGAVTITANCSDGSTATETVRVDNAGGWVRSCNSYNITPYNAGVGCYYVSGPTYGTTVTTYSGKISRSVSPKKHTVSAGCVCSNAVIINFPEAVPNCNGHTCEHIEDYINVQQIYEWEWKCLPCTNGQTIPCYTGTGGTQGVGICRTGTQTCTNGQWGACSGQVLPSAEICDDADNNCDGNTDEGAVCVRPSGDMGDPSCNAQNQ